MGKRVILGTKGSDVGMWVSAPGKAADSSVYEDLLIDTNRINTQPLLKGFIQNPTLTIAANGLTNDNSLLPIEYTIPNYTGTWRYEGWALYRYTINHNLGFIPLCHLSVSSTDGTFPYPLVRLTTTQIILYYMENWGVYNVLSGTYLFSYVVDRSAAGSYTPPCTFHYTLFRQAVA